MRRELPTIVLLVTFAVLVALTVGFHRVVRPGLLAVYAEGGGPLPTAAAVALGAWLLPGAVTGGLVTTVVGLLQAKRGLRLRYLAIGVGIVAAAFISAALAAYWPLLT